MPFNNYNKGTEEEAVNYHYDVLEAKIMLVESLVVSIGSEFIENKESISEAAGHTAGRQFVCIGTGDGYLRG